MKGLSITSEVIMAMGMIVLAIVFSLVSSQIIGGQQSSIFGSTQERMAQEISSNIEEIGNFEGSTQVTYEPPIDLYTLQIRNSSFSLDAEGSENIEVEIQSGKVEEGTIENTDAICISRGDIIKLEEGRCSEIDASDLCQDGGCDPNQCLPEQDEDCSSRGCNYPEDTENPEATQYCDPSYDPDYLDEGSPVTDMGWVDQDYVGAQSTGQECSQNFECGESSSGESLSCNQASPSGPSGRYCCPPGKQWDGSSCKSITVMEIVTIPINFDSSELDSITGYSDYEDLMNTLRDKYGQKTPFKECSSPRNHYRIKKVGESDMDSYSSCNIDCTIDQNEISTFDSCKNQMEQCANDVFGAGGWDKLHGICQGSSCGGFGGIAKTGGEAAFTQTAQIDIPSTFLHEDGHNNGLKHLDGTLSSTFPSKCGVPAGACQNPNAEDCEFTPKSERKKFYMTYCVNQDQFGPAGYEFMKEESLDPYLTSDCT